jgi:hypothetical protein
LEGIIIRIGSGGISMSRRVTTNRATIVSTKGGTGLHMDIRQSLFSFINIGISVIAAYFLFNKKPRDTIASRGPVFMVCFLSFFSVGIGSLPLALPGLFEHLLGHSV